MLKRFHDKIPGLPGLRRLGVALAVVRGLATELVEFPTRRLTDEKPSTTSPDA